MDCCYCICLGSTTDLQLPSLYNDYWTWRLENRLPQTAIHVSHFNLCCINYLPWFLVRESCWWIRSIMTYLNFRAILGKGFHTDLIFWLTFILLGYHLFPTIIVFSGLIPAFDAIDNYSVGYQATDIIGLVIAAVAILIQGWIVKKHKPFRVNWVKNFTNPQKRLRINSFVRSVFKQSSTEKNSWKMDFISIPDTLTMLVSLDYGLACPSLVLVGTLVYQMHLDLFGCFAYLHFILVLKWMNGCWDQDRHISSTWKRPHPWSDFNWPENWSSIKISWK